MLDLSWIPKLENLLAKTLFVYLNAKTYAEQLQQNFTFDESLGYKLAKGTQTFLLFIGQSEFQTLSPSLYLSLGPRLWG